MKRRDSLKTLLVGTVAGATLGSTMSCQNETTTKEEVVKATTGLYGRQPNEIARDEKIKN